MSEIKNPPWCGFFSWADEKKSIFGVDFAKRNGKMTYSTGSVPEWLKGMDCKSIGESLRWFESNPAQ